MPKKSSGLGSLEHIFAERATKVKHKLNVTFATISENTEIDLDTIKRIFHGKQPAKLQEAFKIASALQTTVSYLSNYKDSKYMLENTRMMLLESTRSLGYINSQQAYLESRAIKLTEHVTYLKTILGKIDALNEHPALLGEDTDLTLLEEHRATVIDVKSS